jgi:hypothetical protein
MYCDLANMGIHLKNRERKLMAPFLTFSFSEAFLIQRIQILTAMKKMTIQMSQKPPESPSANNIANSSREEDRAIR